MKEKIVELLAGQVNIFPARQMLAIPVSYDLTQSRCIFMNSKIRFLIAALAFYKNSSVSVAFDERWNFLSRPVARSVLA